MKIIVDSREKWTNPNSLDTHIKDYFDRHEIDYEIRKLDVGDYMIDGDGTISVDRKCGLVEVSRNLTNKSDSARFWREVRRAHEQNMKLVVLVESGNKIKSINDVSKWKSPYSPVSGRTILDEMVRLEMAYGVTWKFCNRRSTAKRIVDILTRKEPS